MLQRKKNGRKSAVPSGHGIEGEEMILDCHQNDFKGVYAGFMGVGRKSGHPRVVYRSVGKFSGGRF
jgi:hypothetical protein